MSEPGVSPEKLPEQKSGPSARAILVTVIIGTLVLGGLVTAAHLLLVELRVQGVDPGPLLMLRALGGSLLAILLVLIYILGWAELAQGWKNRTKGENIFFVLWLIFGNIIGAVVLCAFDPWLPSAKRRAGAAEQ